MVCSRHHAPSRNRLAPSSDCANLPVEMRALAVVTMLVALTTGPACRRRPPAARGPDQRWRIALSGEASAGASAKVEALAVDGRGDTVIAGSFSGVLRVGPHSVHSRSENAGFVVKIAGDGRPQWLVQLGTAGLEARSLALDGEGNALLAASGYVDRGGPSPPHQPFNLTKLSAADGSIVWRRLDDQGALTIVAAETGGGMYVAGSRSSAEAARWGSSVQRLPPDLRRPFLEARDLYVARYTANGERRWSRAFASFPAGHPVVSDLAVLDTGGVAVSGVYAGRLDFGGLSLQADDGRESFVAALSSEGAPRWAKGIPMNWERPATPLLSPVPRGVAFLHSAQPPAAPPPGRPADDYRVAIFDRAGSQTAAFPLPLDSSLSFICCFAPGPGAALFVAGGQAGLFLLEVAPDGTQLARAEWAKDGSPVGLGVATGGRWAVGARVQAIDASFTRYRSEVLRIN